MQPDRRRCWRYQVDAGWAWVVCFASFFAHSVLFGTIQSFGTLFISLLNEFKSGESATAWVGSLGYGFLFVIGPLTACLCEHFGCRVMACAGSVLTTSALLLTSFATNISTMYFTFGVLWGSGGSFLFFSGVSILRFYFNRNLSFANGVTMTGAGFGTLIFNIMLQELDSKYGWRGGMRFLSVFAALTFLSGCAYIPPPVDYSAFERPSLLSRLKMIVDPRPWRDRAFPMWVLSLSFILFAYFFPYTYLVKMALTLGIPMSQGSLLLGYLSISAIFGKLLCGRLADLPRVRRLYLTVIAATVLSLSFMCVTAAKTYHGLLGFAIVAGFFDGCFVLTVPLITQDIVGKELMTKAFGTMYGALAFPLTLGPPLLGQLYKSTGSFTTVFFVSACFVLTGVGLMFIVMRIRPDLVRKQESAREEVFPSLSIHSASVVDTLSGMFVTEPNLSVSHLDSVEIGSYQRFDSFRRENPRATTVDPVMRRLASRTDVEAVYKQAIDNMSIGAEASRHFRNSSDADSLKKTDASISSHPGSVFSGSMLPSTEITENIDSPSDLQPTLRKRQELPLSSETCSTLVNKDSIILSNKEGLKIPITDEAGLQEDNEMHQNDVEQQELSITNDTFSIVTTHSIDPQTAVLQKWPTQEDEPVFGATLDENISVPCNRDQLLQMELLDNREIVDDIMDSVTDVELVRLAPPPESNSKKRAAQDEEDETSDLAIEPSLHKLFQGKIVDNDASGGEKFQDSSLSAGKEIHSCNREDGIQEETLDVNEVLEIVRIPPPPAIPRTGQLVAVESETINAHRDVDLAESNCTSAGHGTSLSEIKLDDCQNDFAADSSSSKDVTTTQPKERLHLAVIDQLSLLSERLEAVAARQVEEEELGGEAGDEQDPRPVFSPALQSLPLTPRYSANHSVPLTPVRAWSNSVNTPAPTPLHTPPSTFHTTAPTPIPTPRPVSQNLSAVFNVASLTETPGAMHPDSSEEVDTFNQSPPQEGLTRHRSRCSSFSEAGLEYVLNEWSHLEQRDTEGSMDAFPSKPSSGTNSSTSNNARSLNDLNSVSEPIDVIGRKENERLDGHWNSPANPVSDQGLVYTLPMCLPQQPFIKPPRTKNPFQQALLDGNQMELQPSQVDVLTSKVENTIAWHQNLSIELEKEGEKPNNETLECLPEKTVYLPLSTNDVEESLDQPLPTELLSDTACKGLQNNVAIITQSSPPGNGDVLQRDTVNGSESQVYLSHELASDAVTDAIKETQIKLSSEESRLNPFLGNDQNQTTEFSQQNRYQQCQAYSSAFVPSEPQSLFTSNWVATPMQQNRLDSNSAGPKSNPFGEELQGKTNDFFQDISQRASLQQHEDCSSAGDPGELKITTQNDEKSTTAVPVQDNAKDSKVDSTPRETQSLSKLDFHQQIGGLPCQYDGTENLVDQQVISKQIHFVKVKEDVPVNPTELKVNLSEGSPIPLENAKEEVKHTVTSQSTWTTFSRSEDALIFDMDTESESTSESTEKLEDESTSSSVEMKHEHQASLGEFADQNTLFPPLKMFSDLGDSNLFKRPGDPEKLPPPPKQAQRKRNDNSEHACSNGHHGHLRQEKIATQTDSIIQESATAESHSVASGGDLSPTLNSLSDITSDVLSDSKAAEQTRDACSKKLSDNSITEEICREFEFTEGSGDILFSEEFNNSNPDEDLTKSSIHDDIAPLLMQNEGSIQYLNLRDLPENSHVLQKRPSTTSSTDDSSTSGTSTDSSLSETEIVPYSKLHEESPLKGHG